MWLRVYFVRLSSRKRASKAGFSRVLGAWSTGVDLVAGGGQKT